MFNLFRKGNCPPRFEHRFRGSGLLVMALVGAAVVGVTSLSLAKANAVAINSMGSNKIAMQAQQYAAAKGELIRATKYTELAAQAKTNIQNSNGFQDEVVVGTESDYDSTTKKKEVIVNVYKTGETVPRSSIIVTRYNKSLDSSIPSGTILPWYGTLGNIPSGFALCNGSNGTPDLRDRFLVGAGSSYSLGNIGGANSVSLSIAQMPSHNHNASSAVGYFRSRSNTYYGKGPSSTLGWDSVSGCFSVVESGLRSEGNADANRTEYIVKFDGSKIVSYQGSGQSHENRPPYYAVYYIMKL